MTTTDRGNWPRWYGVCGLSDHARSEIARWAFYNLGAFMCSRTPGPHGPERPTVSQVADAYPVFAARGAYLTPLLRTARDA